MLIFKGAEEKKFRYNSIDKTIQPGEMLDVRDFDIGSNAAVKGVEKFFTQKYPGMFEITMAVGNPKLDAEYKNKVDALEKEISRLMGLLDEAKKICEEYKLKHESSAGEIESVRREVASMKKEVTRLTKDNDDLEDEIKKLRGASRKPKA